jgi:predicted acylesterase/phospholipase RssA/ABC-type phosphate/phosphonate transport system substrate-binding protein
MLKRSRFIALAAFALALPLFSNLFTTDARRAPVLQNANAQTSQNATMRQPVAAKPTPTPTPQPLVIRIGVVNYNGSEKTHYDYEQVLSRIAARPQGRKVSFRLVDGAYDDVLEWYKSGLLDVAILSPGVVAELFSTSQQWRDDLPKLYVASEGLQPLKGTNTTASGVAARQTTGARYAYRSICYVRADSKITSVEDIKRLTHPPGETPKDPKPHKIKFIFVHPLSVSGYILPEYALDRHLETDMSKEQTEWSYDHDQSVRELLADDPDGDVRVAFVKDDTVIPLDKSGKPLAIPVPIPELDGDEGLIPQDVVLVHPNFAKRPEDVQEVRRLFESYGEKFKLGTSPKPGDESPWKVYEPQPGWVDDYQRVVGWLSKLQPSERQGEQEFLTLEQIVGKLRNLKRADPRTRVALVLSGGGAKCAYQLGAIRAIEDEMDSYTDKDGKREVDIDLVVGTSGGAINALCVALGLTSDLKPKGGMEQLEHTWEEFNQKTFFEPWGPFPATVGLFIGLLQAILLILCVRLFAPEKINWHRHTGKIASAMIVFAALLAMTRSREWAIIPLLILFTIICARLFGNPTREWWKHAGWAMLGLAVLESPVAFFDWTPWRHAEYVAAPLLAVVQLIAIIVAVRIHNTFSRRWWRNSLIIFAAVIIAEALLLRLRFTNYWNALARLGKDHVVHHLWMLATLGSIWTVTSLALVGGALLLIGYKKFPGWRPMDYNIIPSGKGARSLLVFRRHLLMRLSLALAGIVVLQLSLSLFHYDSLSDSAGIQKAMAEQVPKLVRTQHKSLIVGGKTDDARLDDLSRQIIAGNWLTRDLVITSMSLPHDDDPNAANAAAAPGGDPACARVEKTNAASDWYFYLDHDDAPQRADEARVASADPHTLDVARAESSDETISRDARFRNLRCPQYSDKLMDVVIGSSSIFPVFQPRRLTAGSGGDSGAVRRATLAELIDGGFAHNSPIEAAVLWGATHIILVEASPEERQGAPSNYLLANSVSAFNYLFNQAQLTDARSRGRVEIFSLRPQLLHRHDPATEGDSARQLAAGENPCAANYTFGDDGSAPVGANMCTFDFVQDFVKGAIDLGRHDAEGRCFHRERAQPSF